VELRTSLAVSSPADDTLQLFDQAQHEFLRCERALQEARAGRAKTIREMKRRAVSETSLYRAIARIFWGTTISRHELAALLEMKVSEIARITNAFTVKIHCPWCDQPWNKPERREEIVRPASDWFLNRKYWCDICIAKVDATAPQQNTDNKIGNPEVHKMAGLSYYAYLKTDHWQHIRRTKLRLTRNRCQLCGSRNKLNVHHRSYAEVYQEQLDDLIVLCEQCHSTFHKTNRSEFQRITQRGETNDAIKT